MKKIIIKLIKLYQEYLSLDQGFLRNLVLGKNSQIVICRYQPTCSDYTYQAVEKYGVIKGLFLGSKRVLRCHPLAKGGYDPLP
ncbi:membrane protein insertion efficiency factor YidD [candidate division CPR3 bacterium GWF2_35_18]|uniref:Putative membrane protein insertion efficiency factor n=1 Tax=candidate division CPR3 bacterium GW2011_GWF2_35_18 TaxID=1618350 RepID=A0A0G0E2V8_UNCC3|nr:MAG: hypothetical protein UR67_C0005G0054 [candidate division CPR3 bacterium GW2011_GWF2_35_18]KKP85852.1 MAG: hypothetical protein UR87_C0037G0010 [candidate division CPR3 bacterium GW2011_GWE2_35_7]OGB63038.1 MAG: membrane protein insertion efficiency factor YidD [candidate division CPR3 bacterium GWF2_35_18]OGB63938.1 MAG: membrane protein insertion efficiency factor YidD [candidate division CPR3 bacterium RIFOXYA2_FULL_35_13]OGB75754.1 MAG: membrane protein insertion efficiency factor Yi